MTHPIPATLTKDLILRSSLHEENNKRYLHQRLLKSVPLRPHLARQSQLCFEARFRPECNLKLANFMVLSLLIVASTTLQAPLARLVMTQARFKAFELSEILPRRRLSCHLSEPCPS